jgi:hypothetical protein
VRRAKTLRARAPLLRGAHAPLAAPPAPARTTPLRCGVARVPFARVPPAAGVRRGGQDVPSARLHDAPHSRLVRRGALRLPLPPVRRAPARRRRAAVARRAALPLLPEGALRAARAPCPHCPDTTAALLHKRLRIPVWLRGRHVLEPRGGIRITPTAQHMAPVGAQHMAPAPLPYSAVPQHADVALLIL